jgi:hypothetical protein
MEQLTFDTETFQSIVIKKIKQSLYGYDSREFDILYRFEYEDFKIITDYFSLSIYKRLESVINEFDFLWHVSSNYNKDHSVVIYLYKRDYDTSKI